MSSRRLGTVVLAIAWAAAAASSAEDAPGAHGTWWGIPGLRDQWQLQMPKSDALRVPSPVTRDEKVQEVSLKDAIALALENNPGIQARRLEPARQAEGILGAQAQFDPTLKADVQSVQRTTPNASSFTPLLTESKNDDRFANFHLFKVFRTSTQVTIESLNERVDDNFRSELRPAYKPALGFSLVQPLLRNFGWDFSYLVVRVAQQTADAAWYQYEADLANFVQLVIEAYWGVVNAREQLEVQRESRLLAARTVTENEARVKVGLLAPVAVLEAQSNEKARETQVIVAENTLATARQRLAQLAYFRPEDTFVPRTLEPVEEAKPEEEPVELEPALATALADRPEIQASAHGVQARQLNERVAQNGLLPQLNVVGSYGVNALSGQQTAREYVSSINTGQHCKQIPTDPSLFRCSRSDSAFDGPANQAYDRLNDGFRSYSFGVQLQVPLSNAGARSEYAQRRIELQQAELNHRELLSNVTLSVRQAIADVQSARKGVENTRIARELAEQNLKNQERRHEVGMATTKDLLDFQTQLTTARANEVTAKIDLMLATARLRRSQGQLLRHYQIVLERPGRPATPWFARF